MLPENKIKFEAVRAEEVEKDNVILVKDAADTYTAHAVEQVFATTAGSLVFKVRPIRSDVIGSSRYVFPGGNYVVRRIG